MQSLHAHYLLLPFSSVLPTKSRSRILAPSTSGALNLSIPHLLWRPRSNCPRATASDEFPVDETFLQNFGPKEKEIEDEARRKNWVKRGWAPWEEILSPEADFARKSLNEGEEVPLQSPEAIEAFRMLSPNYRQKKIEESGLTEDEYYAKQFEIKGEIPTPLETRWEGPLALKLVPPRDWPLSPREERRHEDERGGAGERVSPREDRETEAGDEREQRQRPERRVRQKRGSRDVGGAGRRERGCGRGGGKNGNEDV